MSQSIFLPDSEPAKKKKATRTTVVVAIMVGIGCVFVVGWVALIAAFMNGYRGDIGGGILGGEPAEMPPVSVETLPQRQADLQAAFASAEPGADPQTLTELRSSLDGLVASAKQWDLPAFRAQLDVNQFLMEAKKTGLIQGLTREAEEDYARHFRESWLYPPGAWERYVIVRVKPLPDEQSAVIVYAYFWDNSQFATEMRLWMARSESGWKLFDWEEIPFGPRRSFEAAAHIRHSSDPRLQHYYKTITDISTAEQKRAAGDPAAAAELLKNAETRPRLPELADGQLVDLAFAWWRLGRYDDCLRCARLVGRTQAAPGGLYLQAVIFQQRRDFRRALDFARQYEQASGGGPQIWEVQAQLHATLDEPDMAVQCWKKLLARDPDNGSALQSLALLLDEHDASSLVDLLKKTSRPAESATSLAERLAYSGHATALQSISEFVAGLEPDSTRTAYLTGLVAQNDGNYDDAAAQFQIAFQRDSDDEEFRKNCVRRFLDVMSAADKQVAGYEQAPDRREAFEYLLSGSEDGESSLALAERKALIEVHRLNDPDDPQVHYQAALVLQEEHDFDGARRELASAIECASGDDERDHFRSVLVNFLHQAGSDVEAYQTVAPADETFRQLIQIHRWDIDSAEVEQLQELHRLHQAANPQDGWLDLCNVLIQIREKKPDDALRTARRGFDRAGDETLKSMLQQLVVELALNVSDFFSAAQVFASPEEALSSLGQRCVNLSDWEKLDALLDWHRKDHPQLSSDVLYFKVVSAWNQRNYAAVIEQFERSSQVPGAERQPWEKQKLNEWHVRSILQSGNLESARQKALAIFNDGGHALPLLLVELADRRAAAVERLLDESRLPSYELDVLYNDSETGAILSSVEFLPVRRKFPPTLSHLPDSAEVVVLLRDPDAGSSERLKEAALAAFGSEVTMNVLDPVPGSLPAGTLGQWLIQTGNVRLAVTLGIGKYHSPSQRRAPQPENGRFDDVLEEHRGWIDIEQFGQNQSADQIPLPATECFRLAKSLLGQQVLALYLPQGRRLIVDSDEVHEVMAAENPIVSLAKMGTVRWLSHGAESDDAILQKRRENFQKSLGRFLQRVRSGESGESFQVAVLVHFGSVAEVLAVQVVGATRNRYGGSHIRGTLNQASKLVSRLSVGEPVVVYPFDVIEWSVTQGDLVERDSLKD
jgi:tetratricopeptide (TPR) repeat protein